MERHQPRAWVPSAHKTLDPMIRALFLSALPMVALSALAQQGTFTLTSKDLGGQATEAQVYNGFGCTGKNISPQLSWSNAPKGTRSFAVTMYDPDAPTGSGWWHWVMYNLPAEMTFLNPGAGNEGSDRLPKGVVLGMTDFGTRGYGGPCPPVGHGPHRYIITVHALGTDVLDVAPDASPALVGYHINANTLARASLIFYHQR
jgi:Raf kinase inhibitor-like YbhB/YbcL family protein